MQEDVIRVAHVVGKMVGGGVESFLMNYYKNIDKNKVQFDFIIDKDSTYVPREEIISLGGRIIEVSPYQNILKYIRDMIKVFKENQYKIVHSHLNALSIFPLFCAKIAGVPIRIAHSHSTTNKKEWKKNLIKNLLKPFSKIFANQFYCCSELAGRWLFGNKFFESGKVTVINNAIDTNKFKYDENIRESVRNELNLNEQYVIGNVGRFITQKNHIRLIELFFELTKEDDNVVLVLVGSGKLQSQIEKKVEELNISDKVRFLGLRKDINEIYQAMDLFLFPTLYEGLGMVLIEAQCSGLPCISSNEVPNNVKITNDVAFIDLNKENSIWVDEIIKFKNSNKKRVSYDKEISNSGYDISVESKKLQSKYEELLKMY